ncbi:MAG: hypothetical protein ACKO86_04445, partial [Dolichospermum sp.]
MGERSKATITNFHTGNNWQRYLEEIYARSANIAKINIALNSTNDQMLFLFMLISGLEVFGTGIISPFITIAVNPDAIQNIYWLDVIYNQLHLNSQRQFLIFLGCFVIIAFYLKAFLAFNAQKTVFKFSSDLKRELSCKLLKAYIEAPYSYHLQIN